MKNEELPKEFEWCRKSLYNIQAELACYPITNDMPLLDGFEEKIYEINGTRTKWAAKSGFNVLEQNFWTASPNRPFVLTGTVGERWTAKLSNISAYDVNPSSIGITPITISTKNPSEQEFLVALNIPKGTITEIIPSSAFLSNGMIDRSQIMVANSPNSLISHHNGDYVVAKHIPGCPEYMQLPESERNTIEAAKLYDPRIINGTIMQNTYDHAKTKAEIIDIYKQSYSRKK